MPFGLGFFATAGVSAAAGSFDLLESQVLTGSASSVTFSSLSTYASTYQHLQIRGLARTDRSVALDNVSLRMNGDGASNYTTHQLEGSGSSVSSASNTPLDRFLLGLQSGASSTANVYGAFVADLLDPFETTKFKTLRSLTGTTSASNVRLYSGSWRTTASLTSLQILPESGFNFVTGSRFSLYGWKAA